MPRPPKCRFVQFLPNVTYFRPPDIPAAKLQEIRLTVDELEALRLKDMEGWDQESCAQHMNVAQSTFQRILTSARAKITEALVEGKAIRIEGGNYCLWPETCPACGSEKSDTAPCPKCGRSGEPRLDAPHRRRRRRGRCEG